MTSIKGKTIKGKAVRLEKSTPEQLSLFQTFLGEGYKYSNTIELYDAIPKYFSSTQKMKRLREEKGSLPFLKRSFEVKNKQSGQAHTYHLTLKPARLEDEQGNVKDYYPTEREELVEEALRKMASDSLNGVYLNTRAGVQFTFYQLRKELAAQGHAMTIVAIKEALQICNHSHLEVREEEVDLLSAPIFPVMMMSNRREWLENPKDARCYVQFNPLVTQCINQLTYRQFNYLTHMKHKRPLTRWLHKRLAHNYTQANIVSPYHILATTIIRNSAWVSASRFRDNIKTIDGAMDELKEKQVIYDYEKEIRYNTDSKTMADVKYILSPSFDFVGEMKTANKRKQLNAEQASKIKLVAK